MMNPDKTSFSRGNSTHLLNANALLIPAIVLLLTIIIYIPSLQNDVLTGWDDGEYIENEQVRNLSVKNTISYFSEYYLGMYQPIPVFTFALNYLMGGDSPFIYHLTNLLLHLVNILLVMKLFNLLVKNRLWAGIAALFFAIHPMQVEAVAWISTRSSGLYAMFYLLAIITYLQYHSSKMQRKKYILTLVYFVLSLFSKAMAISLPFVLLLIDYFLQHRISKRMIIEKIPFFALSLLFGLITLDAAGTYSHITNLTNNYHLLDRAFLVSYGIVFYLFKFLLPVNQSAIYTFPAKESGFLPWEYYISFFVLLMVIILLIRIRKKQPGIVFGFLFFVVNLLPVLPFFWSRIFIVSERYFYIASAGLLFIALNYLLLFIKKSKRYIVVFLIIVGIIFSLATINRIKVWKDTSTLLTDVIVKNRSANDVAAAFFYRGNTKDKNNNIEGALDDYNQAIRYFPEYTIAYNNRGIVKGMINDLNGALSDFSKAIELNRKYADAYYNRGLVNFTAQKYGAACNDWQRAAQLGSVQARIAKEKYCGN